MASTPRTKSKSTGRFTPDQIQMILRQGNVSSVADIQSALHEIFGQALQSMLEGELDDHLGYTKMIRMAVQFPERATVEMVTILSGFVVLMAKAN